MADQTINGNNRSNIIISGATDDEINAGGGNDLVISGAGDDTINGGAGRDIIISGSGDDVVNGGSGSDILITGDGDDTVSGGSGNDIIITGDGNDTVSGGTGNDLIITGDGDDIVDGGAGHDVINTGSGDDTVSGGSGSDVINTGSGNDTANGDGGNDLIVSGSGSDDVNGNGGHDVLITGSGNDTINGGAGNDIIVSGAGNDNIAGGDGHDVILAGDGADTVSGGSGDDVIIGGYGDDTIDGGSGYDWIHAGADNDTITGGSGNDYINGGSGIDVAIFSGNYSDYTIVEFDTNAYTVTHNTSGEVDTVVNVETFRFDDRDVDPANPGVNTDPVANDDVVSLDEDTSATIDVLANDTDADGDALTVTSATATNGSVAINADGTITYTPAADFNGSDTITYEIADGNGGTSTATVSVTVNAVNDGPVAADDSVTLDEDTSATIDVLANDSDVDGDALTVTSASASNGTVVVNADGTITYTPVADFNGSDTITYEIADGNGGTSTATVSVTVNAVNDGPVATDDSVTLDEDTSATIDVLANDTDTEGDALTVSSATATNGAVTINADGTITYTPAADFNGSDTITYEITDGNGGASTATVAVTVNPVNDGPVAADDSVTLDEDTSATIDVLANDSDVDGDALTVTSATATNGTVAINADGTITYTPVADFNGSDTITYEIADGNGGTSTATVAVTVNAVNDGPVANNDSVTLDEDTAATIDVLANDTDTDGDALTVTSATATNGSVAINAEGTITYTPAADFNGSDTITYEIADGNGGTSTATVAVTVNAVNDGPVAADDSVTLDEDTSATIDVLANDSDVDGDALTVTSATATNGTVAINADGTITYTPVADFNGSDTITYEIADGNGGTSTATVSVTVNAVNDGPVAVDDSVTLDEDTSATIDVLANDTDTDGDALTVTSATATNGSVAINADGTITYTPAADFNGSDTITYEIADGNGGTSTATVAVTVNAVNDGPVAADDSVTLDEDTSATIDVLANDSDVDGDALTVTSASASNGTVVVNADGTITYTPVADFNGSDTITYEIADGNGGTSTATVSVTVNAVNDGPVATDDSVTLDEDTSATIDVLANDTDTEGDALTVTSATATNGSVAINADGTITYTPAADLNGSDTITYEIADGNGGTSTATVAVTVNAVNDGPVAADDSVTLDEETSATIDVLANDSDVDGDALTVTSASATNGTVAINADGTITYTPVADFNGSDTITYEIADGNGGTSTATVAVTVNAVNDGPVANNDSVTLDEDTSATIDVLANDTDSDGDALVVDFASANNGSVLINADGTITYTPNQDFAGSDTITYEISDGNGGTSTATVAVTVNPVNDAPEANDDAISVTEDSTTVINVLANDIDADGDALTITSAAADNGVVSINADGTITYTPNADFNGADSITYQVEDGNGGVSTAVVSVDVQSENDAPVATGEAVSVDEDASIVVDVLANDTDAEGDSLSISSVSVSNGTVSINADGTLTYTPVADFNGTDTITYTIADGNGGFDTATVEVTVNPVNDGPVAQDDVATTPSGVTLGIDVLANDSDLDGDALSVSSASASNGSVVINADGTISYSANPGFVGADVITYEVSDGNGGTAQALVNVDVTAPLNNAPEAVDDVATVDAGTNQLIANLIAVGDISGSLVSNDIDADGDALTITHVNGQALVDGSITIEGDNGGFFTIFDDGRAFFDSTTGFESLPEDQSTQSSVVYTVSDGNGGFDTATVTVTVVRDDINETPVVVNDTASVDEDATVVVDVLANDTDLEGDALSVTQASADNGSVVINADGTISYTPNANFNGVDTITYQVSDGNSESLPGSVAVTVNPINDAPIAVDDELTLFQDTSATINVLDNDSDLEGDALTLLSATAGNGTVTVNPDGTIEYTPAAGFSGTDTIEYQIEDEHGLSSSASVNVTVQVNTAPDAVDDAAIVEAGTLVDIAVADTLLTANDSDADGDAIEIVEVNGQAIVGDFISVTGDNGGVFNVYASGYATFDSTTGFESLLPGESTTSSITYTIADGRGGVDTATVTVTIQGRNDAPDAVNDTATTAEDTSVIVDVLANDSDMNGNTITLVSAVANQGVASVNADGTITYTPPANFNGDAEISYTISDGITTSTATVFVTVDPVNDIPVAVNDVVNVEAGTTSILDVLDNDSDIDGDALTIQSATATNGTVTVNADGTLSYTPDAGALGLDTISYEVSDGNGGTSTATVTINRIPTVEDESVTLLQDSSVIVDVLANDSDADGHALVISTISADNGTVTVNADSSITYTPNAGFAGSDQITYVVQDGEGGAATGTVTVTVEAPANNAPVANDDVAEVTAGTDVVIANLIAVGGINGSLVSNDTDADGDSLTITHINGQALVDGSLSVVGDNGGTFTVFSDGRALFDSTTGFEDLGPGEQTTSSITYTVSDGNGGTDTASVTVTISQEAINSAPEANNDTAIVDEDASVIIDVLGNDTDVDGDALTVVSASVTEGTVAVNADGTLTYTPDANFNGSATITYTINDEDGLESTATVDVTVSPVNDGPVANDDTVLTYTNAATTIDVLSNDSDLDGDALTVSSATAQNGTVVINADGTITYTANAGFTGADQIEYEISDGNGGTATATVAVTVDGNAPPEAIDDVGEVDAGTNIIFARFAFVPGVGFVDQTIDANDTDPDGDTISIVGVNGQPLTGSSITTAGDNGGTFTIFSDGRAQLDARTGFESLAVGESTTTGFSYTISDGNGGTDTASVVVTVNGINDAPDAVDDTAEVYQDDAITIDVLANDTDIDGDAIAISSVDASNLSGATVVDNGDGTITFNTNGAYDTLAEGESASDWFEYTISDGQGSFDTARVLLTIQGGSAPAAQQSASAPADDTGTDTGADSNDFM